MTSLMPYDLWPMHTASCKHRYNLETEIAICSYHTGSGVPGFLNNSLNPKPSDGDEGNYYCYIAITNNSGMSCL